MKTAKLFVALLVTAVAPAIPFGVGAAASTEQTRPLVLNVGGITHVGTRAEAKALQSFHVPWGTSAVTVDASGRAHEQSLEGPSGLAVRTLLPLDDGGFLALGSVDTTPGVTREDGPDVKGVDFPLVRFDAAGAVEAKSDVRVRGEDVSLLGATTSTAFLQRGVAGSGKSTVVARDLASGSEAPLGSVPIWATASDLSDGELALAGAGADGACRLVLLDTATGRLTHPVDDGCRAPRSLRLSPDGTSLAVIYDDAPRGFSTDVRLAIRDVVTGATVHDWLVGNAGPYGDPELVCGAATCDLVDVGGSTWLADGSVEVALVHHPTDGDPRSLDVSAIDGRRFS